MTPFSVSDSRIDSQTERAASPAVPDAQLMG
jgi:hypothetical protein